MDGAAFEQVHEAFQDFQAYLGPVFGRRESQDHSRHYLQALLVQSQERRNAENLSETVPVSARAMQRYLTGSPWKDDVVIGRLQGYLGPRLGHPEAVWVLDGSEPRYHLSNAPEDSSPEALARVGGSRWRVETEFETEKSDVGLDEYETRTWGGVASPCRPMPAGRSHSPESATGLGGRCQGSPGPKSTGWCGRCCPGNGSTG